VAFTYFFRDRQTLELIVEEVLPTLRGYRYIRIWDAGCAHGPEAYSLAMLLRENMTHFLFRNVRICATDIDASGQFGDIIAEGVYPERELKRIPEAMRVKYFQPAEIPGYMRLCEQVRRSVGFMRHNLLSLRPPRRDFRLIVCKNVLLHFSPQHRVEVLRMFYDSLAEGGYLVTEHTQKLPRQVDRLFERVTCKAQVFRKLPAALSRAAA